MSNKITNKQNPWFGFTLAELLIALAILGVIATFTIPKILDSSDDGKKKAVLKETFSAIYEATHLARIQGIPLTSSLEVAAYYGSALNAVKVCSSNMTAEGCVNGTPDLEENWETCCAGAKLHNGAIVSYYWSPSGQIPRFMVDYNAETAPNTYGEDELEFLINPYEVTTNGIAPGKSESVSTPTLYHWLFEN